VDAFSGPKKFRMAENSSVARSQWRRKVSAWSLFALFSLLVVLRPGAQAQQAQEDVDHTYQARIPMGAEAVSLGKGGNVLYLLAMAEAEQFEGWRHVRNNRQTALTDLSGANVTLYPASIRFRVTASTRKNLLDAPPYPAAKPPDVNELLLGLRFQLKMFRGLRQTVIRPDSIQMIGVPEDIPYDERIYEVTFSLGNVPITDRCQLEVDSPSGERLARFHLDLY
jgi:hypothetical protein